jgi:hypothetical protein
MNTVLVVKHRGLHSVSSPPSTVVKYEIANHLSNSSWFRQSHVPDKSIEDRNGLNEFVGRHGQTVLGQRWTEGPKDQSSLVRTGFLHPNAGPQPREARNRFG